MDWFSRHPPLAPPPSLPLPPLQGRGMSSQVVRYLSGVENGLRTVEEAVAGLDKLHLQRHSMM